MTTAVRSILVVGLVGSLVLAACSTPRPTPLEPHKTLLGIAAEYQLLRGRDVYRDRPADELTGLAIERATLIRLANYEALNADLYAPEVAMLRGGAYERLLDLESARDSYAQVPTDSPLATEAAARARLVGELLAIRDRRAAGVDVEAQLALLADQSAAWNQWARADGRAWYDGSIARALAEQADVARAELLAATRLLIDDGDARAVAAHEALLVDHAESRRALEHALRLATLHRGMAEQEARLRPPETLDFDATTVFKHVDAALDLYARVSQADGAEERLVARHELDAVLAWRRMVRDRADAQPQAIAPTPTRATAPSGS